MIEVSGLPSVPDDFADFRKVLFLVWAFLKLPAPTFIQYDIANYLQHGPRRKLIEAFRGIGKSWITAAYVCWRLRLNPQLNILVVSASKERADNFSTFALRLIHEMPVFQCLMPHAGQRESKVAFDVGPAEPDHAPSVKSVGITGQLTGSRAHIIIPDDIEVPGNSQTQAMRDKLAEQVKEFDAIIHPGGEIAYLGTPQCEQSIYNTLPQRGYAKRIWPAEYPNEKWQKANGEDLAPAVLLHLAHDPSLAGKPADPRRFDEDDLAERKLSYGRSGYALQYMLDTSLSDADRYPLKLSDLIVMDLDRELAPEKLVWAADPSLVVPEVPCVGLNGDRYYRPFRVIGDMLPYTGSVMAIDPSGRGKDETSFAVVNMLSGYLFLMAAGGVRGGYSEDTLLALARLAKVWRVNNILVESNFGDGMFTELLKPHLMRTYQVGVEEVRSSAQKERRIIDTLEPVMNGHKLVVNRVVIQADYNWAKDLPPEQALKYQLFYQMSRITKDRGALAQDDRLDAVAMAVAYWVKAMGQDVDVKARERQGKLLQRELDAFTGQLDGTVDSLLLGWEPTKSHRKNCFNH